MKFHATVVCIVVLCLALVACSTSQVVVALNVASVCVGVASTAIAGVPGLDDALQTEIAIYLNAVSTALAAAASDLKSGTITARQVAGIVATLTSTVAPALPDSVPATVRTAVAAVSAAVEKFVATLSSQPTKVAANRAASPAQALAVRLSRHDKALLDESLVHLAEAEAALASLPPVRAMR